VRPSRCRALPRTSRPQVDKHEMPCPQAEQRSCSMSEQSPDRRRRWRQAAPRGPETDRRIAGIPGVRAPFAGLARPHLDGLRGANADCCCRAAVTAIRRRRLQPILEVNEPTSKPPKNQAPAPTETKLKKCRMIASLRRKTARTARRPQARSPLTTPPRVCSVCRQMRNFAVATASNPSNAIYDRVFERVALDNRRHMSLMRPLKTAATHLASRTSAAKLWFSRGTPISGDSEI